MKLIDLVSGTDVICPDDIKGLDIKGIAFNSEEAKNGDVFVLIKGNNDNGKFYSMDAAFKGARVIISDEDIDLKSVPVLKTNNSKETLSILSHNFYRGKERIVTVEKPVESVIAEKPQESISISTKTDEIKIVGITGTNGKTTVSYLLKQIYETSGTACGLIGTIQYSFKDKVYNAINTTPEFCYLEKLLLEMRTDGVNNCVMEVSSQALDLGRVDDVKFDSCIFTNLSQDHLDFHKDMDSYFQSKTKLFFMSQNANFINIDDEYGKQLISKLKKNNQINLITYSALSPNADYTCIIEEEKLEKTVISVYEHENLLGLLKIPVPGTYMVSNVMAALACAHYNGIEFSKIKESVESLGIIPGRFEKVENEQGKTIVLDYAHTPTALKNLLQTVNRFKKGKLYCVFGCGGDRDKDKRGKMGKVVGTYADFAVITSDNPRTENQELIAESIEQGLSDTACKYEIIPDRYDAIKRGLEVCSKGDILIIAGKGHETYQIIGAEKHHFDDKEVVKEILKGTG